MLTVADYSKIRIAKRDGMSIRAITKAFHHSHHTVQKALVSSEPKPYQLSGPKVRPKLDGFEPIIDQILRDDEKAPLKQRHTAAQIARRLHNEHGFTGSYDIVRRYVKRLRLNQRETFIPLSHDPGQRMEADFGHIYVDFPEGRRLTPVMICTWAYSNYPFAIALPTEKIEAILAGMTAAFTFFGCVPHEVWWDNPKTVVVKVHKGHKREINRYYLSLASHYTFEPLFCMPARGNEKPRAENRVFDLQRRWATPVPKVSSLDELNNHLLKMCRANQLHTVSGYTETIGVRYNADQQAAQPLPRFPFDPCVQRTTKVDKYQTVVYDNNYYSVPRRFAFQTVTINAYVQKIVIVHNGQVIAEHPRSYHRDEHILDPLHYLVTLARHPAALDHSAVFCNWELPATFLELRRRLEERHGALAGVRHFIRVLQLHGCHSTQRINEAIIYFLSKGLADAELISQRVERSGRKHDATSAEEFDQTIPGPQITVPRPDLNRYNQLLNQGDNGHVRERCATAEDKPAALALADHLV